MERNNEAKNASTGSKTRLIEGVKHFNTQNDGSLFLVAAQESLEQGQVETLLEILQNAENRELLGFVGWDLVKVVFPFLPKDCLNCDLHISLLKFICNACNPREICLSLSELFSYELTSHKLLLLLEVLTQTCNRLEGKISKILSSILSPLQRCIRNRKYTVEEQDAVLRSSLEFVGVLVQKVRLSQVVGTAELAKETKYFLTSTTDDVKQLKNELVSFLIALLEHPVALLEFRITSEVNEERKTSDICVARRNIIHAEKVAGFLGILENRCFKRLLDYGVYHDVNLDKALELPEGDDEDMSNSLSCVGLGCLSFLTHIAGVGRGCIPKVTTWKYALDTNMVYINCMLSHNEDNVISKGLYLLKAVLDMIIEYDAILDDCYVDKKEVSKLLINLRNLMIYCKDKVIRKESVEVFRNVLGRFTPRGKYRILRSSFQGSVQTGFAELLTLILKEEIAKSLETNDEGSWFLGSNLRSFLLDDIFKLPFKFKAFESEFLLIEENNRVLSALNLLRFLLIKDDKNKTTIQTLFPKLEETYFKELTDAIQQSKARIAILAQQKHDELQGKIPVRTKTPDTTILNVTTIDGGKLEQGSLKEQLHVLQSALLTVDLIKSVLERTREIYANEHGRNI